MGNEDCVCGHPEDMHNGYMVLECLTSGCECQKFRLKNENPYLLSGRAIPEFVEGELWVTLVSEIPKHRANATA